MFTLPLPPLPLQDFEAKLSPKTKVGPGLGSMMQPVCILHSVSLAGQPGRAAAPHLVAGVWIPSLPLLSDALLASPAPPACSTPSQLVVMVHLSNVLGSVLHAERVCKLAHEVRGCGKPPSSVKVAPPKAPPPCCRHPCAWRQGCHCSWAGTTAAVLHELR